MQTAKHIGHTGHAGHVGHVGHVGHAGRAGYDQEMHTALEMWLLMRLQEYLYRERLLLPEEVDLSQVWRILDGGVRLPVSGCAIWQRGRPT